MTSTDRPSPGEPHGHHSAEEMHNEDVAHEHTDVEIRTVLAFGAGLVAVVAVCAVLMWVLFGVLERQAAARDPQISPLARPAGQGPPAPTLQTNEPAGLAEFRAEESKTLEGYGWVDQLGGVAHIPIAEAKKLTLERGLPVRGGASTDDGRLGTHAYAMGEASGGRTLVKPKPASALPPPPPAAAPAHGEAAVKK